MILFHIFLGYIFRALQNEHGVDAVIYAYITEYKMQNIKGRNIPVIGIVLIVVDATTGQMLWSYTQNSTGEDEEGLLGSGFITNLAQLSDKVSEKSINALKEVCVAPTLDSRNGTVSKSSNHTHPSKKKYYAGDKKVFIEMLKLLWKDIKEDYQ